MSDKYRKRFSYNITQCKSKNQLISKNMKKNFTQRMMLSMLTLVFAMSVHAQETWNVHQDVQRNAAPAQVTEETSDMFLGHCDVTAQIYESDGLSLSYDSRIGAGIVLPREVVEKYQGGVITAMYVGWDDPASYAKYSCFVRENEFSAEDYTSGEGNVVFGWNKIKLNPVPINDVERLCVGFYTNLKKGVCSIPYVYPNNVPNSIFLYDGVSTDANGNEKWEDMHMYPGMKSLAIMLVVSDPDGRFHDMVEVLSFRGNPITWRDTELMSHITIKNVGSNNVSSITVNTSFNGDTLGNLVPLNEPIGNFLTNRLEVPIYSLGSGYHDISVVEVNGTPLKEPITIQHEMITIPQELEGVYTSLPIIEMFVSEESDHSVSDYRKIFLPGFERFAEQYNLVMHHVDDKYMWGDNDALVQMLQLADNDSSKIFIPALTVNRSDHLEYLAHLPNCPFHYGTPFPEVVDPMWKAIAEKPTFASVNIDARFTEDKQKITIDVLGDIAENVLPNDEKLNMTVYVMEKNVVSQDQKMFNETNKTFYYGEYVHPIIVRDILTPYWGEPLQNQSGEYKMSFTADVYPEYNLDNLYVVAFLNRAEENGVMRHQIINSNLANIGTSQAVNTIANDNEAVVAVTDGVIYINGSADVEVYSIAGAQVANNQLVSGVYIARMGDIVAKVSVR